MLDKLNKFHESKPGYAFFALFGLVVAFLFINWSIDSGNWYDYLIVLIALIVFLQNLGKFIALSIKRKGVRR